MMGGVSSFRFPTSRFTELKTLSRCIVETDIREIANRLGDDVQLFADQAILVCGGAGFLGRYFTALFTYLNDEVLTQPCRIIVCDNQVTSEAQGFNSPRPDGFQFLPRDIIHPFTIDEPVDYIIQAAGIASPHYYRKYPLETLEVATLGTKHALLLGSRLALKGFLFFSSSEIYGDPDPQHVPTCESYRGNVSCHGPRACYDESKRLGETLCIIFHERYGVPAKIVRPFNVYGPGMPENDYRVLSNFASSIIGGRPLHVYGTGRQTRTFCYVTDALVGFIRTLLHGKPAQAYNIGSPSPEVSMLQLAQELETLTGRRLDIKLREYPDSYPADEPQRRCPDIGKARLHFNYQPQVNLQEGLKRFMDWAATCYTGSP